MTNRIYLRVPSTNCEPSTPCNRYYFDDGTMVDLNADVRCGTCRNWETWQQVTHIEPQPAGWCSVISGSCVADFACAKWEPRKEAE